MIYLFSATPFEDEEVTHIPIIQINFLTCKTFTCKDFNALLFTSKHAVRALDMICTEWKSIPSYVIGNATAKEVKKLGGRVEFISKSAYGDEFAQEIHPLLKDKKILFPRAKEVVSDIKTILTPLFLQELIVYETKCSLCKNIKKPLKNSILIFTSPSTLKCFLKYFSLDKSYKIICIGTKTSHVLPKGFTCKIPTNQSIQECVKLAKKLKKG